MGLRHGLVFGKGLTIKEMICCIIYHVITGECYASHCNIHDEIKLGIEFRLLICTTVAAGSSSAELCTKFVHHILSYGGRATHLTMEKLRVIGESLGLQRYLE